MAPVEYSSIRKGIMTPMACTQMVYRPNEQGIPNEQGMVF